MSRPSVAGLPSEEEYAAHIKQARREDNRRLFKALFIFFTVFLLSLGATQAFAADDGGVLDGTVGGGGNQVPKDDGTVKPPGTVGPATPDPYDYWSSFQTTNIVGCAAVKNNGEYQGVRFSLRFPSTMSVETAWGHFQTGSYRSIEGFSATSSCVYSAQWETKTTTCLVSLEARLLMTTPTSKDLGMTPYTSKFKSSQALGDCETGGKEVAIKKKVTDFGRYKFEGDALVQDCSYRHYTSKDGITGATKADEITKCGSPRPKPTVVKRWQLDCDGFHQKWSNDDPSWNANDCKSTPNDPGSWQCTAAGDNSINGKSTSTATLFRDGENNRVVFGTSRPKGSSIVKVGDTKTRILRSKSSSPWRNDLAANKNVLGVLVGTKNVLSNANGSQWLAGTKNDVNVYALDASDPKNTTALHAEYRYDLTVKAQRVTIKSVNTATGEATVVTESYNKATTGNCESAPVSLNFTRAVTAW